MKPPLADAFVTLSPPLYFAVGVLTLLFADQLTRRVSALRELCIPRPVTGGLLFSGLAWLISQVTQFELALEGELGSELWSLVFNAVASEPQLHVDQPFLIGFFTCVGLSCSVPAIRQGGRPFAGLLATASVLALLQALMGIGIAVASGFHPGLGLACGPVSMTGGHGTTAGFAPLLESAGFPDARAAGFAAATLGLLVGGVIAGPLGSWLIRRNRLRPVGDDAAETVYAQAESGFVADVVALHARRRSLLWLLPLLLLCFKAGAWLSFGLQQVGLVFPVYMGAMMVGAVARNILVSVWPSGFDSVLQIVRSICIGLFLVLALMDTSFGALADIAWIMLIILSAQVLLAVSFAWFATYRLTGSDFGAALVAAGHCGFALGATPNALAAMEAISRRHGRAFRPFFAVSLAGGFFLDFANAFVIIAAVNALLI